ncbi:baseplate J/gp47 family protein [uncultured Pseudacidovorax sp.]|uniref:baseplate J/gp47 family protein n=1 Tax=uncultured Pseudacidovorax sp. TaxID=679313 RepID=UPI0025D814B3|nr:baseplate J/gp47 family protein [uncultured Pseudacidovorax sp.]
MFERPTLRTLVARTLADTLSRLTQDEQLRRSDAKVYARVLAGLSHEMHGHLQWIAQQVIYDTAEAEILERWASMWGITRKPAVAASGAATVTGAGVIPAATTYRRADGVEFVVVSSSSAPGTVSLQASVAGAAGNTDAGTTLTLLLPINGVVSTATVVDLSNGSDVESDASLRERFLARIRRPPNGGSADDYVSWALEVPGVTRAWVFPQELGPGTVTIRFVRDGDAPIIPDEIEVAAVQSYIDYRRPVTAQAHVFAPTAKLLNFQIKLTPDTPAVRAAVSESLSDLLAREAVPGGTILISHIREAISVSAGETDHELDAPTANVTHASHEMAVLGDIEWL